MVFEESRTVTAVQPEPARFGKIRKILQSFPIYFLRGWQHAFLEQIHRVLLSTRVPRVGNDSSCTKSGQ